MILVTTTNISLLTDAILWAGIEFCVQCEAYESGVRNRNLFTVLDLSELDQLSGNTLYIMWHGHSGHGHVQEEVSKELMKWEDLGKRLSPHLPDDMKTIHVMSCFAAGGPAGNTGLHRLGKGIAAKGTKLHGYKGPVVSNIVTGPVQIVDSVNNPLSQLVGVQDAVKANTTPDLKLKAWRMTHGGASRVETAAAAAEINWDFFEQFTNAFKGHGYFYGPTTDGATRVTVTV